jgi:putative SOS response-associated peptidase YedK
MYGAGKKMNGEENTMCGRFQLLRPEDIAARFETVNAVPNLVASADVRPTQPIAVVDMARELKLMQWGLVPSWAKERPSGAPLINARAEGIETKPTFRKPLRFQRCIIPATGFYEWQAPAGGGRKIKYLFTREDGDFLALAGLYDTWKAPEGRDVSSCVIITTTPNELVAPVHNRMPVILTRDDEDAWLDPDETESEALLPFLRPLAADALHAQIVA